MDKTVNNYIEELYEKKTLSRKQYSEETELTNFGQGIDDDVARMMQVFILATRPKKVLEIGTSIGFSTVMMAKAMQQYDGKIVTIELDEKVAEQAKVNFKRQGVDKQIEVVVGDARTVVAEMDQTFDLIFQDIGAKSLYAEMFDSYLKLLNPGGILMAEDTLYPAFSDIGGYADKMREPLDRFNKVIAACPHFVSTLLPIGDGLTIAVKN